MNVESEEEDAGVVDEENVGVDVVELAGETSELEDVMKEDDELEEPLAAPVDVVSDDADEADVDDPAAAICLAPHTPLFTDALTMLLFM